MINKVAAKVELFRRGFFDEMGLFEKQMQAMDIMTDDQTSEMLYGGGVRGGKSKFLAKWKIYTRLAYDGSRGMTCREELVDLRDTTMNTFEETLQEEELRERIDYIKVGDNFYFDNGSEELFKGAKFMPKKDPKFNRFGSFDLTDVALDEAQQINFKGYSALRARLSLLTGSRKKRKNGIITEIPWKLFPKMYLSCNPSKNWLYKYFYMPNKRNKLADHMAFIPALATDNPYITQDYIDNLKKGDKETVQRLLFGNWEYDDSPEALVQDYDRILDIFTNSHVKPNGQKTISADLAMQGRDRFIGGHFNGNVGTVDIDMEKASGRTIEIALQELKNRERVPNSMIVADADGLGAYLESYIQNIKAFHGGRAAYDRRTFSNLKSQCAWKLAELINQGNLKIICSEEQEQRIANEISVCLKRESMDKDTIRKKLISKDAMKADLGNSPDYLDWLIMAMLFKVMPKSGKVGVKVN